MRSISDNPDKGHLLPLSDPPLPLSTPPMANREPQVPVPWLVHAIALVTPVLIAVAYYAPSLFSVHVAFMSFSYLFIIPQGIILAVSSVRNKNRPRMIRSHMYIQLAGMTLAMVGLAAQFTHRQLLGKAHFKDLHSWLGVATLLSTQAVALGGLVLFYFIPKSKRSSMPRLVALHRLGGRLVFIMAVGTMFEALKIFDPHHKRNKGWITYLIASLLAAQAVGMQNVLWPRTLVMPWTKSQTSERALGGGANGAEANASSSHDTTRKLRVEQEAEKKAKD